MSLQQYERTLSHLVNDIKFGSQGSSNRIGVALLIGAGCSVSAGIPDAKGMVDLIHQKLPEVYKGALIKAQRNLGLANGSITPSYQECMNFLAPDARRKLIADQIEEAKVNWAHVAIAQLLLSGSVDRVLTTNFDPLVLRACSLVDFHPAVYDLAVSKQFIPGSTVDPSVLYLHGQHTGYVLVHTNEDFRRTARATVLPALEDATTGKILVVVGYSGENDPVFEQLCSLAPFRTGLYWVCYKDNEPPPHVRKGLFASGNYSYCVRGYDADDLFVRLAQQLGCFPPRFATHPFSSLEQRVKLLTPYSFPGQIEVPGQLEKTDVTQHTVAQIRKAKEMYETRTSEARWYLLAGLYEEVFQIWEAASAKEKDESEMVEAFIWASIMEASRLAQRGQEVSCAEANQLFEQASKLLERAVEIDPNSARARHSLGVARILQATRKEEGKADRLFAQARQEFQHAISLKRDLSESWYGWAYALSNQAKTKQGSEADRLFAEANEKYQRATKINPSLPAIWNNWGSTLIEQAKRKKANEADKLFAKGCEMYEYATALNPDDYRAYYNWGNALFARATHQKADDTDDLFAQAFAKYERALQMKPELDVAWNNWGSALIELAKRKEGSKADSLYAEGYEKYKHAIEIEPDRHDVWFGWGNGLLEQAKQKRGPEADELYTKATRKYQRAIEINPDKNEAWGGWAAAIIEQAKKKSGVDADQLYFEAYGKLQRATSIMPDDSKYWNSWGVALFFQAEYKSTRAADCLYKEAYEKFERAIKIDPENYKAWNNWGVALSSQAEKAEKEKAEQLYAHAYEKFQTSLGIKRDYYEAWCSWGRALVQQAMNKKGAEAEEIYKLAYDKLQKAVQIRPNDHGPPPTIVPPVSRDRLSSWLVAPSRSRGSDDASKDTLAPAAEPVHRHGIALAFGTQASCEVAAGCTVAAMIPSSHAPRGRRRTAPGSDTPAEGSR